MAIVTITIETGNADCLTLRDVADVLRRAVAPKLEARCQGGEPTKFDAWKVMDRNGHSIGAASINP